ncbi:DUF805 domain-containing protein [Chitinophaga deserti]|uniref:DUF805 domain-containing protein n=1 Tax=Chitinophaga deserti TaxID=2164099 RepID=UPI000D6BF329|nr:DUF805 domain-containing protein [Chitinophaga deserti]
MKHITTVFKKFTDFNGRASRAEFWTFFLFNIILSYAITLGLGAILGQVIASILNLIVSLVLLLPGVAVAIRRMHDVNKSGWYMLIPIYSLILALTEGDKSVNNYGPDPYSDGAPLFDFENQNQPK